MASTKSSPAKKATGRRAAASPSSGVQKAKAAKKPPTSSALSSFFNSGLPGPETVDGSNTAAPPAAPVAVAELAAAHNMVSATQETQETQETLETAAAPTEEAQDKVKDQGRGKTASKTAAKTSSGASRKRKAPAPTPAPTPTQVPTVKTEPTSPASGCGGGGGGGGGDGGDNDDGGRPHKVPRTAASARKAKTAGQTWEEIEAARANAHIPLRPEERQKNGRQAGRGLIIWTRPRMIEKLVLHMYYELNRHAIDIPWDSIAHRLHPGSSGSAIVQHLNRVRAAVHAQGHLVPPPIPKPGARATVDPRIRGYVRQDMDGTDATATRPVFFSEVCPDRKFNLPDAAGLSIIGTATADEVEEAEAAAAAAAAAATTAATAATTTTASVQTPPRPSTGRSSNKKKIAPREPSPDPADLDSDADYDPAARASTAPRRKAAARGWSRCDNVDEADGAGETGEVGNTGNASEQAAVIKSEYDSGADAGGPFAFAGATAGQADDDAVTSSYDGSDSSGLDSRCCEPPPAVASGGDPFAPPVGAIATPDLAPLPPYMGGGYFVAAPAAEPHTPSPFTATDPSSSPSSAGYYPGLAGMGGLFGMATMAAGVPLPVMPDVDLASMANLHAFRVAAAPTLSPSSLPFNYYAQPPAPSGLVGDLGGDLGGVGGAGGPTLPVYDGSGSTSSSAAPFYDGSDAYLEEYHDFLQMHP